MKKIGFKFMTLLMVFLVPISVLADPATTDPANPGTTVPSEGSTETPTEGTNSGNTSNTSTDNNQSNSATDSTNNVIYQQNSGRSTNANLGSLQIDGVDVDINTEMTYTTSNQNPSIVARPSSDRASIRIDKPDCLSYGDNVITITVTAENFYVVRVYTLHLVLVSNDASLKGLTIDGKEVTLSDDIEYRTDKKKVEIEASTTNENASVVYENTDNLVLGKNKVIIRVTAEDGVTVQEYTITVTRVKKLIGDVGVTVKVNGEEAKFKDYKSEIIYIDNEVDKIDIDYELSDKYAEIDLDYDKKMKVGDRKITFTVTAENGKTQEYVLNIHRFSVFEEILAAGIGVCMMGGVACLIFFIVKKIKKEKRQRIYKVKLE